VPITSRKRIDVGVGSSSWVYSSKDIYNLLFGIQQRQNQRLPEEVMLLGEGVSARAAVQGVRLHSSSTATLAWTGDSCGGPL